jgi:hypothetical protein
MIHCIESKCITNLLLFLCYASFPAIIVDFCCLFFFNSFHLYVMKHLVFLLTHSVGFLIIYILMYNSNWIINMNNCKVTLEQLGTSVKQNGWVEAWVINVFCRKLFKDKHPRISNKHFFFHTSAVRTLSFMKSFCFLCMTKMNW